MKVPAFFKHPRKLLVFLLPLSLFLAGWWFGLPPAAKDEHDHASDRNEVWTCSMHPQIRQPNPGLCPICNMDLILLQDDGSGGLREVTVSAEAAALLDLRVTPVRRAPAVAELRMFGRIAHDERRMTTITSRVAGRLDKLYIDYTGAMVRKGEPLAEIYSPELLVAQRELIAASKVSESSSSAANDTRRRLLEAAREKLRLLQFSNDQILKIENAAKPDDHLILHAPQSGLVVEKMVTEGRYVKTGEPLFRLADHSLVWLNLEAYESDLAWLEEGQLVTFEVEALPGKTFSGPITYIDHEIDPQRRVAQIRIDVENPENLLLPGMYASAKAEVRMDADPEPLLVPGSAVLRTGERAVVYVRLPEEGTPVFEGRQVVLGSAVGDEFIVKEGLEEGELVVTRGAFKLDSELQIKGRPSMMNPTAGLEERPAGTAPESLRGQWQAVLRALFRFENTAARDELISLTHTIESINIEAMQPDDLKLWREVSNQLLVDLKVAESEGNKTVAMGIVRRAIETAGRHLGLPYQAIAVATADPSMVAELKTAVASYLPVAKALADDDDPAAKQAAASLQKTFAGLKITSSASWGNATQSLVSADGIKARRVAFQSVSDQLIELVRSHGIDQLGDLYVVHCPMAFGSEGADWLSAVPSVINPYFGDSMLNCGNVADTLSVEKGGGK